MTRAATAAVALASAAVLSTGCHTSQTSDARIAIPVDGHPLSITAGEGAVWVGTYESTGAGPSYEVARLDPDRNDVETTIAVGGRPTDLTAADGSVWVVLSYAPHDGSYLVEIDASTNDVVGSSLKLDDEAGYQDVAWAAQSVWTASSDGTLLRIDPSTHEVAATLNVGDGATVDAAGDDVWVADTRGDVWRVDVDANELVDPPVRVGWNVEGMEVQSDAVWIGQMTPEEEFQIVKIDPVGPRVVGEPIRVDLNPGPLTADERGLWVMQHAVRNDDLERDGTIIRIDPATSQAAGEAIPTGAASIDLTSGWGSLWVTKVDRGEVYRISPDQG